MSRPYYYVFKFRNPAADGGDDHFSVIEIDERDTLERHLGLWKQAYPHLEIFAQTNAPRFNSRMEAEVYAVELGKKAQALNPERVGAEHQNPPGEFNRILEVGKPGPTPPPGALEIQTLDEG